MKKNFKLMVSLLVAIFTLSMFGNTAFADGSLKDGTYDVNYTLEYVGEGDSPVDLRDFFLQPAILTVEDGAQFIELEHTAPDMIESLEVKGGIEVVSEDEDTRIVKFKVDNLSNPVDIGLVMFYGQTHDTQASFDVSDLPRDSEDPEGDEEDGATNGEEENGTEDDENGTEDDENGVGAGEDNGDNGNGTTDNEEEDEVVNPQTGDSSNILLYSLLMIGALVPLTVIVKRRFN